MANNIDQNKQLNIRKQLNYILIKNPDSQMIQPWSKARKNLDWMTAALAPWTEYGSNVFAATKSVFSQCVSALALDMHFRLRRFQRVFGGLLESCSSLWEVGHLLCNGGVSADATVISSPAPRCIGTNQWFHRRFQAFDPK